MPPKVSSKSESTVKGFAVALKSYEDFCKFLQFSSYSDVPRQRVLSMGWWEEFAEYLLEKPDNPDKALSADTVKQYLSGTTQSLQQLEVYKNDPFWVEYNSKQSTLRSSKYFHNNYAF